MARLDRLNEGCSIDGPKERVKLDLKGLVPGAQLTDKARGWRQGQGALINGFQQAWSGELAQVRT